MEVLNMKYQKIILAVGLVCVVLLYGCQEQQADPNPVNASEVNRKIVSTYSDLMIQNAIITQHTLYPYHFVNNSALLNDLGEKDLAVLIEHFLENPGKLIFRQGETEPLLYQGRVLTVYEKMLAAGIADEKIHISDGMPGGEGVSSNVMIEILEDEKSTDMTRGSDMGVEF